MPLSTPERAVGHARAAQRLEDRHHAEPRRAERRRPAPAAARRRASGRTARPSAAPARGSRGLGPRRSRRCCRAWRGSPPSADRSSGSRCRRTRPPSIRPRRCSRLRKPSIHSGSSAQRARERAGQRVEQDLQPERRRRRDLAAPDAEQLERGRRQRAPGRRQQDEDGRQHLGRVENGLDVVVGRREPGMRRQPVEQLGVRAQLLLQRGDRLAMPRRAARARPRSAATG